MTMRAVALIMGRATEIYSPIKRRRRLQAKKP